MVKLTIKGVVNVYGAESEEEALEAVKEHGVEVIEDSLSFTGPGGTGYYVMRLKEVVVLESDERIALF